MGLLVSVMDSGHLFALFIVVFPMKFAQDNGGTELINESSVLMVALHTPQIHHEKLLPLHSGLLEQTH